jgi:serine/threonine protein kinase
MKAAPARMPNPQPPPLALEAGRGRGLLHARFRDQRAELVRVFASGPSPLDGPGARLIHQGRNRLGVVSWPWMIVGFRDVVVKEFGFHGANRIKTLFGPAKALRAWRGAVALIERGLPTPFPVVYLEERRGGLVRRGFYLSGWVAGAREIRDLFRELEGEDLRELLAALAPFLRECHDQGVLHRDLSDGNILVKKDEAGRFRFILLDTNRIRIRGSIGPLRRVRNLVRLGVPAEARRAFVDLYLGDARNKAFWFLYYRTRKAAYASAVALKKKLRLRKLARALKIQ